MTMSGLSLPQNNYLKLSLQGNSIPINRHMKKHSLRDCLKGQEKCGIVAITKMDYICYQVKLHNAQIK